MKDFKSYLPYIFGGLVLIIFWNIIKKFVFPNMQTSAAMNDLVGETGEEPTISKAKATSYAHRLKNAIGWFDDDEAEAKYVFNRVENDADVMLIQAQYHSLFNETLAEWMQALNTSPYSYDDGTKAEINQILSSKGIKYRF